MLGGRGRPPLWPWSDLVVELSSQQNVTAEPDPAVEPLDRFGLFRAVAEQLRGLCERRPAIALIDDLHGANQDARWLTHFVARSLHRFPLLLVVTWRTGTSPARSDDLAVIAQDGDVVELPPLSARDVASYLELSGSQAATTPEELVQVVECTIAKRHHAAAVVRVNEALSAAGTIAVGGIEQRLREADGEECRRGEAPLGCCGQEEPQESYSIVLVGRPSPDGGIGRNHLSALGKLGDIRTAACRPELQDAGVFQDREGGLEVHGDPPSESIRVGISKQRSDA